MCGIAGIATGAGIKISKDTLMAMTRALTHRGPDEEGLFLDSKIGLGIRRLKIIDLVSGKQPQSRDNLHIVFNGEIYNYKKIRLELEKQGISFRTKSDTEVILEAYRKYGANCLSKFNGMFAIAIWDQKEKKLFIARDRLGVKPLYYSLLEDDTFIFASEIKALLKHPALTPEINLSALNQLFSMGFSLCPHSFFKNVFQLNPGYYMEITEEQIKSVPYWDLDFDCQKLNASSNEIREELFFQLKKSVNRRLVSDVPVAAYLSGGLDSSAVSGLYSSFRKSPVETFSIGFPFEDFNELDHAQKVSAFFGTQHTPFECKPDPLDLPKLIFHLEEPMLTLLPLPLFYLSQKVSEHEYKVVLSGDGADELLGGYDYFRILKAFRFIDRNNGKSRQSILKKIFPGLNETGLQDYIRFLKSRSLCTPPECPNIPYFFQSSLPKQELFSPDCLHQINQDDTFPLLFHPEKLKSLHLIDQLIYMEMKFRLLNLTLPLSDKMSMANSVENRSPFLDYRFVEFTAKIPPHLKILGMNEKFILKHATKDFLPDSIVNRKKQPLSAPVSWYLKILHNDLTRLTDDQTIRQKGYFNSEYIKNLKTLFQTTGQGGEILWVVMMVHLWDDIFLQKKYEF